MKEFYSLVKIPVETETIQGVDILLVLHPRDFPLKTLWAIDQFLMNGGKVLLVMDPHAAVDQAAQQKKTTKSILGPLLKAWGMRVPNNSFAGDKYLAAMGRLSQFEPPGRLLPLVQCDERCTKGLSDIVSTGLNNLIFFFPRHS